MKQGKNVIITPSVSEFMRAFPEVQIPKSIEQTFHGMFAFRGDSTPNITKGVEFIDKLVTDIKTKVFESYRDGITFGGKTYFPTIETTESLLSNISLCFVTSKDTGKEVKVSNIFNEGKEETISIIEKFPEGDPYFQKISIGTLLGYYYPLTGSIIIFIDNIILGCKEPDLELQRVILHEFIHAVLDISPRGIENNEEIRLINRHLLISDEERPVDELSHCVYNNIVAADDNLDLKIRVEGILKSKFVSLEIENNQDYKNAILPGSIESGNKVPTTPEKAIEGIDDAKYHYNGLLELDEDTDFLKGTYQIERAEFLRGEGWDVSEINYPENHVFGLYAIKKVGNLNLFQRICLKKVDQEPAILTFCLLVNENLCLYYDSTDFIACSGHDEYNIAIAGPTIRVKLKDEKNKPSMDELYAVLNECIGPEHLYCLSNNFKTALETTISGRE